MRTTTLARTIVGLVLTLFLLPLLYAESLSAQRRGGFSLPPLLMTTPAFEDGAIIPDAYTCAAGQDVTSPPFSWTGAPDSTVAYAIIFHDLDVALGGNTPDILHWVLWNIPAADGGIPAGMPAGTLPNGTVQGRGMRGNGYLGPCSPAGERYHHYVFELYALGEMLDIPETSGRDELLEAMAGKVTAKAAYVGRFHQ